jgi:hypothetical protein
MGRWKRKKNQYNSRQSSAGTSNRSSPFSHKDLIFLLKYLGEYQRGAENLYWGKGEESNLSLAKRTDPIVIGGQTFLSLTDENLKRPYLALPKGLSSKQRRSVHELCVESILFHCSVGETDRFIAVSIYYDGLALVLGLKEPPKLFDFRQCKPWVYGRDPELLDNKKSTDAENGEDYDNTPVKSNKGAAAETNRTIPNKARNAIQELIDQPGECLRDEIDALDFAEMETQDLSTEIPPGLSDEEWMLVDSAEKMNQCIRELEVGFPK